jgi:thiol-disulfide isomerase/thioredoxin
MRYLSLAIALTLVISCDPPPQSNSGELDINQYRGRWLVVNYWAEWCVPCRKEIPELNQLSQQLGSQVAVLGVNYDGLAGIELANSVANMGIEFTAVGPDPASELNITRPVVLPTTYLIDPEGKLRHTLIGPQNYHGLSQLVGAPAVTESPY